MTNSEYREICESVSVLSKLLATEIRSFCPPSAAAKRLENQALRISDRFTALSTSAITTAAQRRGFARAIKRHMNAARGGRTQ